MSRDVPSAIAEQQFTALVDSIVADAARRDELLDLLHEDHALFRKRSATTIVRMRGWVLLALERVGVSDAALPFVLEELDTGMDPYLVAAAARALRTYLRPGATLAPFVMNALANIRFRDEPVTFDGYGAYAVSSTGTSALHELLSTLAWLGPHASHAIPELEALLAPGGLPARLRGDVERALQSIRDGRQPSDEVGTVGCCSARVHLPKRTRSSTKIDTVVLEDHAGEKICFKAFFRGRPSIVTFFYTRCDNPLKCSLTVAKLARVQQLLEAQGAADQIRTAAITYDPAFDLATRLRVYGQDRGLRMDADHRLLRAVNENEAVQSYFGLGVNNVGSLVNRHRIELYVLDAQARLAASFTRLRWDEGEVVACALEVLKATSSIPGATASRSSISRPTKL
jgi:protein SCO1